MTVSQEVRVRGIIHVLLTDMIFIKREHLVIQLTLMSHHRTISADKSHSIGMDIIFCNLPSLSLWRIGVWHKHECLGEYPRLFVDVFVWYSRGCPVRHGTGDGNQEGRWLVPYVTKEFHKCATAYEYTFQREEGEWIDAPNIG